jgi:hypothetical protein
MLRLAGPAFGARPAAQRPARSGYRGEVAKKSRNRGGATAARRAPANAASGGLAKTGTAQLTAPAATSAGPAASTGTTKKAYPGEELGLPQHGPGSVSSTGRRIAALFIDWLLCTVIALWLTHSPYWTIVVFAIEVYVLTALGGITAGKRLLGMRTIRVDGGPVGFGWALLRTVILLTVVLPLLTDNDLRGLHDRAANTVVVRI